MDVSSLLTERLLLVPTTIEHLHAELHAPDQLSGLLGAVVPPSWPPGQYDRDAMAFFLARMTEGGAAVKGWYGWYAILRALTQRPATLVAAGGYFGPPSADGVAEIGYSVVPEFRGQGYATELVDALTTRMRGQAGVRLVAAETSADNLASLKVLDRCGFKRVGAGREPGYFRFERALTAVD